MINKKLMMALLVTIVVVGCTDRTGDDRPIAVDYRNGYDGLKVSILDNNPPREILEEGRFTIAAKISNEGAYNVRNGVVSVAGINQAFTKIEEPISDIPPLEGKSFNAPNGGLYLKEFRARNIFVPPGLEEYANKYWVEVVYDYESVLNADICISAALLRIDDTDTCLVNEKMSFNGQGAPIAITTLEEVVSNEDQNIHAQFRLNIQNKGKGNLVSPVIIEEVKVANRRLNCRPRELDPDTIKENRAIVVCDLIEPNRGAYTTTLSATISYVYRIKEDGKFLIKKLSR